MVPACTVWLLSPRSFDREPSISFLRSAGIHCFIPVRESISKVGSFGCGTVPRSVHRANIRKANGGFRRLPSDARGARPNATRRRGGPHGTQIAPRASPVWRKFPYGQDARRRRANRAGSGASLREPVAALSANAFIPPMATSPGTGWPIPQALPDICRVR